MPVGTWAPAQTTLTKWRTGECVCRRGTKKSRLFGRLFLAFSGFCYFGSWFSPANLTAHAPACKQEHNNHDDNKDEHANKILAGQRASSSRMATAALSRVFCRSIVAFMVGGYSLS